jgi:hypothetical protein
MPTNSDSNQTSTGSVMLSPSAQAVVVGIADDDSTIASADGALTIAPVATSGGNDTISIDSASDLSVTVVRAGSDIDSIDSIDVVIVGGAGGNDTITVVTVDNSGSGLAPLTISVAPFIDDGAEGGAGGSPSSGGNDTITLDDGPGAGTDIVPGDGSFIPLEPGDTGFIDGSNGTLGMSVLGPTGGADGGDPVSADIREAPIIIVDPPIDDGRGNPPIDNGGGFELVPVRIGAPLPPLDPDDLLDAGLGTVEVSLPPAALVPPVVNVPPPVLDNGLTMIAQAVPAAGSDDSLTILAATA